VKELERLSVVFNKACSKQRRCDLFLIIELRVLLLSKMTACVLLNLLNKILPLSKRKINAFKFNG